MQLQRICNFTGERVQRRIVNGRQFIVCPLTMLRPGVLAGSDGPLYYGPEVVRHDPWRWNSTPITLGHPVDRRGRPVSASVAGRKLGFVRDAMIGNGGDLRAKGWFDSELVRQHAGQEVLDGLAAGERFEVSTGVGIATEPAPEFAQHNGASYSAVVRRLTPDHLALLVGQVGACSLSDQGRGHAHGCGVNNNTCGAGCRCGHCSMTLGQLAYLNRYLGIAQGRKVTMTPDEAARDVADMAPEPVVANARDEALEAELKRLWGPELDSDDQEPAHRF